MRKLLLILILVLAAAVGFSVFNLKAAGSRMLAHYLSAVEEVGDYRASAAGVRLSLWPRPAISIHGLSVDCGGEQPCLSVPVIHVFPRLLPLLSGRARVSSVLAEGVEVVVLRDRAGHWKLPPLIGSFAYGPLGRLGFELKDLKVEGGRFVFVDENGPTRLGLEVDEVSLGLSLAGGGVGFTISAVPFGASSRLEASGVWESGGGPTGGHRLDLSFKVDEAALDRLEYLLPEFAGKGIDGPVSFVGSAAGYLGERSSEDVPAEPLLVEVRGSTVLDMLGTRAPLMFRLEGSVDDQRIRLGAGQLEWDGLSAAVTGWTAAARQGRVALRFSFDRLGVAEVARRLGVPLPWRPRGMLTGVVRVDGSRRKPRLTYQASLEDLSLERFEKFPLHINKASLTGSIMSINAEVSASVAVAGLSVGSIKMPAALLGLVYWRDRLTFTSLNNRLWDGQVGCSAAYDADGYKGGALVEDVLVAELLAALLPGHWPIGVEARLDGILSLGGGRDEAEAGARVGMHDGRVTGFGLLHAVVASIAAEAGLDVFALERVVATASGALGSNVTEFSRLVLDLSISQDGFEFSGFEMTTAAGTVRALGSVDGQGNVMAWGELHLDAPVARIMIGGIPALAALASADGSLFVPVTIGGSLVAPDVVADPVFLKRLALVGSGRPVAPFSVLDFGPGLSIDLPSLDEHFGR
jgi:hypothetical protein